MNLNPLTVCMTLTDINVFSILKRILKRNAVSYNGQFFRHRMGHAFHLKFHLYILQCANRLVLLLFILIIRQGAALGNL